MVDPWMKQSLNADIFVATSTTMRSTTYHFNEQLGRQIAGVPGVKRLENVRFTSVPYDGDSAALIAIELDGFMALAIQPLQRENEKTPLPKAPNGASATLSHNIPTRLTTAS